MKKNISLIIFIFIFSCKNKNIEVTSISQTTYGVDSLKIKVKNTGDITAYDELYHSFKDSNEAESIDSIMVYSKIMSKKYNYKNAYLHYFDAICEKNNINPYEDFSDINLNKIDYSLRNEAIICLKKMLDGKIISKNDFDKIMNNMSNEQ